MLVFGWRCGCKQRGSDSRRDREDAHSTWASPFAHSARGAARFWYTIHQSLLLD
jgi:hypothetical protein